MKIVHQVSLFGGVLLLFALGGAALSIWTANRTKIINQRIQLAHSSYEQHLDLTTNTYQLFKQYSDAVMSGEKRRTPRKVELIRKIRNNIKNIREIIGKEIEIAGQEEIEELELLRRIEQKVEDLISRFQAFNRASSSEGVVGDWANFSIVFDNKSERDFRTLINRALDGEVEEIKEANASANSQLELTQTLAYTFAVLAIAVAALAIWFYRNAIAHPLGRLTTGIENFRSGQFSQPIGLSGTHELADIALVLDDMAAQVDHRTRSLTEQNAELEKAVRARTRELERLLQETQKSEINRRRLLADVSHELRTPLTIIQGESDIALRGEEKTPREYRDALIRTRDAAKHTSQLVNDLLFISRKEAGQDQLKLEETDLLGLLRETVEMSLPDANFQSREKTAVSNCDGLRLRQAIVALLQNAKLHGGKTIVARLEETSQNHLITIEDDGPGLSPAEKKYAFERFYRGPNAAANYGDGAGLGLPVVRAIAEAHGGSARIEDRPAGGTAAIIELPKQTP